MDESFEEVSDLGDPGLGNAGLVLAFSGTETHQLLLHGFYTCKPLKLVEILPYLGAYWLSLWIVGGYEPVIEGSAILVRSFSILTIAPM